MSDLVELFRRSVDLFTARVDRIDESQWHATTPCRDWDVRALVNHVTSEQLWAPHLVAGETIEEVGDRYDGDVLGADPVAAWHGAVKSSVAAFAHHGALDRTVHLSYGDESCREYLLQMLTDAAVHGWDLARGTGQNDHIDGDTAELLLAHWTEREALVRASGVFGKPVKVPADASAAMKLLGLLGRNP